MLWLVSKATLLLMVLDLIIITLSLFLPIAFMKLNSPVNSVQEITRGLVCNVLCCVVAVGVWYPGGWWLAVPLTQRLYDAPAAVRLGGGWLSPALHRRRPLRRYLLWLLRQLVPEPLSSCHGKTNIYPFTLLSLLYIVHSYTLLWYQWDCLLI